MANETEIDINVAVRNVSDLRTAANALAAINSSLRDVQRSLTGAVGNFDKLERSLAGVRRGKKDFDSLADAARNYQKVIATDKGKSVTLAPTPNGKPNPSRDANGRFVSPSVSDAAADRALAANSKELQRLRDNYGKVTEANTTFRNSNDKTTKSLQEVHQGLSTTRYALFDVGRALGVAGVAMLGFSTAIFAAGIAWERDFANVIRTSNLDPTSDAVNTLRRNFQDLAASIPVTADELAKIGTLGGQLGISAGQLTGFTETVAQFAAVTGMSVEESATVFGRLNALLPDVQGNFDALGSAILFVGRNSVATESEIGRVSTQISSMGDFAGLTAADVIGLAGALSSVGVQPELARGTVTRLFTLMSRAVAEGGDTLDEFARISGVSSDEFSKAWGTDEFGDVFLGFMGGIRDEGGNAVSTLNALGVASVRDVPALLRLANAADSTGKAGALLAQTFGDARDSFGQATDLASQYAIINDTVASKIQKFVNNIQNLMAVISQGGGIFGGLIDGVNSFLETLTDLARNPVTNFILQLTVVIGGLLGVLALVAAGAAFATASTIALRLAVMGLTGQVVPAGIGLTALNAQMVALGVSSKVAGAAVGTLKFGLIGLVAAASAGAGLIGKQFTQGLGNAIRDGLTGVENETADVLSRLTGGDGKMDWFFTSDDVLKSEGFTSWAYDVDTALGNIGLSSNKVTQDFIALDDTLADMAAGGSLEQVNQIVEEIAKKNGVSIDAVLYRLPDLRKQLELYGQTNLNTSDAAAVLGSTVDEQATALENLATQLGLMPDELEALQNNLKTGSSQFVQYGDLIQRVQNITKGWAEEESKQKYDSKDSWQEFYDGVSVNIYDFMDLLDQQIAAQSTWAGDLQELAARGATGFVSELAKMGPEGAPLAAAAVKLTAAELMKLEQQAQLAAFLASEAFAQEFTAQTPLMMEAYRKGGIEAVRALIEAQTSKAPGAVRAVVDKYNLELGKKPIVLNVNADAVNKALSGILGAINTINGKTIKIKNTDIIGHAEGGHIRGPGTGTSDSILARLSNNEFVMKSKAVNSIGPGVLNYMNKYGSLPGFASGGLVGSAAPVATSTPIVELGPQSMRVLRDAVSREVGLYLDPTGVARLANAGNKQLAYQGA